MKYKELVDARPSTKIDQYLYGQPYDLDNKYRETYHKIGKVLNRYPHIYRDLRVSGLGSTNSLNSILSVLQQLDQVEDANLVKYMLFELGRLKAAASFALIKDIQMPLFNTARIPIYLVKEDILNPLRHAAAIGMRRINLLDFDSCSSLTGESGEQLVPKLLTLFKCVLDTESIVHCNFVVKSFRIKSNQVEFSTKITSLLDNVRKSFEIQDRVDTSYQTIQGKGVRTLMGGVILKLRRLHVHQE